MMQTGVRPDGSKVNAAMRFQGFRYINDVDLWACIRGFEDAGSVASRYPPSCDFRA
jgi:hypothetical protein